MKIENETSTIRLQLAEQGASDTLLVAHDAAREAATVLTRHFTRGVEIRSKSVEETYNLVSDADVEAERAIAARIRRDYPEHAILGEEEQQGLATAGDLWIVDPLDGTNNFVHRIPHFAVSIAYYRDGAAQCGMVLNPVHQDCYWAERGCGAFHNGRRLTVSSAARLDEVLLGVGFYYDRGAMMEATLAAIHACFESQVHGIRRFGTAALDLCQVADGLFGAYFEYQLSPWDFAAGRLIVEEAGGTVTTTDGGDLPLATSSLLASNGRLHRRMLELVSKRYP